MRRTKAGVLGALAAVAVLGLAACGGGTGGSSPSGDSTTGPVAEVDAPFSRPKVADAGDVTVTVDEGFQDYNNNTGAANSLANVYVLPLLQPGPYFLDENFVLRTDTDYMASVKVTSTNPQVIEYKWRPEAVWSDGQPVGCKDMYLLYLAAASPVKNGEAQIFDSSPTGYEQVQKMDCAPDGKTVTVTMATPFADYRGLFSVAGQAGSQLVPAHILEQKTGIADLTKIDPKADSPDLRKAAEFYTTGWTGFDPAVSLSAGPYKIESSVRNATTVLVRNDKWWGNPGGPAKITITSVTDSQAAVQKLLNKEAQVIAPQAESAVAEQIRAAGGDYNVFARGGQTYEHIDFNMSRPLFKDNPELRKSVATCVNRERILDNLVRSVDPKAVPLGGFLYLPGEKEYVDNYADVGKGDVGAAKKLMEDGGWVLGPDGVYAKNGVRASFAIGHKLVDRRAQTVQQVIADCKPAGIEITDNGREDFNDVPLPASDFDAALFAWVGSPVKSNSVGNYVTGGAANYNKYTNPEVDKLLNASNIELDEAKRVDQFHQADKLMAADVHSIPLFQLPDFSASVSQIAPVGYVGAGGGALWNAFAWEKK